MEETSEFSVRPYSPAFETVATQIWKDRFGTPEEKIHNWLRAADDDRYRTSADLAVTPDETVVGIGVLEVGSRDYVDEYLGVDDLDLDLYLADLNGVMHMYCVRDDWEGRGVASAFFETHLTRLDDRGVDRAFGISWHRPHRDGADSRALFEKFDFDCLGTYDAFYQRASPRMSCPDCEGACTCTASIYARLPRTDADGK